MNRPFSTVASILSRAARAARTALANSWLILTADRAPTYQPELHYMRGPGPKVAGKTRARSWHRLA